MKNKFNYELLKNCKQPYIIAELGANHNGDMNLAKKLIIKAKEAGCDCVKFQSWTKNSIFSKKVYEDNRFLNDDYRNRKDYTLEQIVEKFSISEKQLKEMKDYCDNVGIDFCCTPFSNKEVDFLTDILEVPFIKIASMDLNNYPFIKYIAKKRVPIVLSTGLSTLSEIDEAVRTIEAEDNYKLCLLHCVSIYPPDDSLVNLNNMETLHKCFSYPVGFSDHTLGTAISLAAVAKGACIIEKHFTLNKNMFGWDHKISADFCEMQEIVNASKRISKALGNYRILVEESDDRKKAFRRSIVATRDIQKGSIIYEKDLDFKRPGNGLEPKYKDFIIGKVAKRNIKNDEIININDF